MPKSWKFKIICKTGAIVPLLTYVIDVILFIRIDIVSTRKGLRKGNVMRETGKAAIIVMGIYAIILSISRLEAGPLLGLFTEPSYMTVFALLPTAALVGLGVFLIRSRETLSVRWFPDVEIDLSGSGVHVVRLGLIFTGLFFSTLAASSIIVEFGVALNGSFGDYNEFYTASDIWRNLLPPLIGSIIELIAGVFLIIESTWIARKIWSIREDEDEDTDASPTCPACGTPYDPADYRPEAESVCFVCHQPLDLGAAAWNAKAESLDEEGRHEGAQRYYDRAIELDPNDADLWNNKAIGLDSLNRPEEAITSYDNAIRLRPDDAEIWFNRAESLRTAARPKEAIASYEQAIELDSCHADAILNKAKLEQQLKDSN